MWPAADLHQEEETRGAYVIRGGADHHWFGVHKRRKTPRDAETKKSKEKEKEKRKRFHEIK